MTFMNLKNEYDLRVSLPKKKNLNYFGKILTFCHAFGPPKVKKRSPKNAAKKAKIRKSKVVDRKKSIGR